MNTLLSFALGIMECSPRGTQISNIAVAHDASATHLFWRYGQAPNPPLRTIQRTHLINLQIIGSQFAMVIALALGSRNILVTSGGVPFYSYSSPFPSPKYFPGTSIFKPPPPAPCTSQVRFSPQIPSLSSATLVQPVSPDCGHTGQAGPTCMLGYIAKVAPSADRIVWAVVLGGDGVDSIAKIVLAPEGSVIMAGNPAARRLSAHCCVDVHRQAQRGRAHPACRHPAPASSWSHPTVSSSSATPRAPARWPR
jgi:hypothetical protein